MKPIVNGLEKTYGKEIRIVWVDVGTGRGRKLAREQGFIGQPMFIFFDASGQEVRRLMGPQSPETLQREVEQTLGKS